MSKSATALYQTLQKHDFRARDVPVEKTNGIVEIHHTTHPVDGAKILLEHGILGAVVVNDEDQKYCGFFDMRDLLSSVIYATREIHHSAQEEQHRYDTIWSNSVGTSLYYLARRNPVHPSEPDTKLEDLMKYLATSKGRRVIICNPRDHKCTNIITRRSLLKFLRQHVNDEDLNETMKNAGLEFRKDVIAVYDSTSAFDTFELMDRKGLYGIAIVDEEDGKLMGYTSASDIRLAAYDAGKSSMDLDILSYLALVRQASHYAKTQYPVCHVYEDATMAEIINKLVKTGYHRIFVVDRDQKPVGVVSLYDVLKFIISQSEMDC